MSYPWSEEREQELIRLKRENYSLRAIGRKMGLSVSSISGKQNRMKLVSSGPDVHLPSKDWKPKEDAPLEVQ